MHVHVSITTPVVPALKANYTLSFLDFQTDILSHYWTQMAVSEVKRPSPNCLKSEETVKVYSGYMHVTAIPQRTHALVRV